MFAADPKLLQQVSQHVKRVLIVDPHPASSRLLGDLMKGLGCRNLYFEPDGRRALELAREVEPNLILIERSGARLDGEDFVRRLRRSDMACRMVPVIMVTADATATTIKGARDAGVHEFLRKPFTAGDLLKRVAVVFLKPRNWVEAVRYVGPDRRRFNSAEFSGSRKRKADTPQSDGQRRSAMMIEAVQILRSALGQFDHDPNQACRSMREQTQVLKRLAVESSDGPAAVAVTALELALSATPTRAGLVAPVEAVLSVFEPKVVAA